MSAPATGPVRLYSTFGNQPRSNYTTAPHYRTSQRPISVMDILNRCRDKIAVKTTRPWFDMNQSYFMRSRQGIRTIGELIKALTHYRITLTASEVEALFEFFPASQQDGSVWFDFKAFANTLFPRVADTAKEPNFRQTRLYDADFVTTGVGATYDTDVYLGVASGVSLPPGRAPPQYRHGATATGVGYYDENRLGVDLPYNGVTTYWDPVTLASRGPTPRRTQRMLPRGSSRGVSRGASRGEAGRRGETGKPFNPHHTARMKAYRKSVW